ncbi:hypothetical protein O9G_006021 [Rozella allomycis CSF55]|uniref:Uncharacterized protein n=1 Tax=Rozella allomycis (strain CSF55) TaxID=988480 RepID=A0A075AY34_ROZAC|nr:hypothetical protein O9G_006021 [Rozella allomycis CSF55]|eukprot:EPZ35049.1 hypothetical protein O9G_006021 [Rozella allomycis CSF55]
MTINKAHGQTLKKVGIFVPGPVFTHGQLYVTLSRARSISVLKLQQSKSITSHKRCFS